MRKSVWAVKNLFHGKEILAYLRPLCSDVKVGRHMEINWKSLVFSLSFNTSKNL